MEELKVSSSRSATFYLPLPRLYFSGEYYQGTINLKWRKQCFKNILQLASNICCWYKNAKDNIFTPHCHNFCTLQVSVRRKTFTCFKLEVLLTHEVLGINYSHPRCVKSVFPFMLLQIELRNNQYLSFKQDLNAMQMLTVSTWTFQGLLKFLLSNCVLSHPILW